MKSLNLTEKQKKTVSFYAIILLLIFCAVVGWFIGKPMIEFVSQPDEFRNFVDKSGIFGRLAFVFMVIFQVVLALIPGEPLEIGAGYAFGAVEGTLLCILGITVGSIIVFYLVRNFGIKLVEVFFSVEKIKSLKFLQNPKKTEFLVFLLFFLPGTPKDLLTYFVGLTDIKLQKFIIIVSLARIPSVITSTIGGSLLGVQKYTFAIVVFLVTFAISICGWAFYNYLTKGRR